MTNETNKNVGEISQLFIYPIKSCAGIKVDRAIVTKYGLAHADNPKVADRKWMIVDEDGHMLTQRKVPKMALLRPKLVNDEYMLLTAPGMDDIKVPYEVTNNDKSKIIKNCRVWGLDVKGIVVNDDDLSKWLCTYLQLPSLYLVYFDEKSFEPRRPGGSEGPAKENYRDTDGVSYADHSALMILSESSILDLNKNLSDNGKDKEVTVRNFRPNILIKDCEAFEEDNWSLFQINDVKLRIMKPCTRCSLTTVDPETGVKDANQEPLNTLKKYRSNKELWSGGPMFGINVAIDEIGKNNILSNGDYIHL